MVVCIVGCFFRFCGRGLCYGCFRFGRGLRRFCVCLGCLGLGCVGRSRICC